MAINDDYLLYFQSVSSGASVVVFIKGPKDSTLTRKYDGVYKVSETNGSYVITQNIGGHITKHILSKRAVTELKLQFNEHDTILPE